MNFIQWTGGIFQQVLAATISASVLVLVVMLIQFVLGRRLSPAWRHTLWLLVLLRFLIPVFPESRFSLFNLPRWIKPSAPAAPRVMVTILDTPLTTRESIPIESSIPEGDLAFPDTLPAVQANSRVKPLDVLGLVWFGAAIVLWLRLAAGSCWLRFRLAGDHVPVDPTIRRILLETRGRMRSFWNPRPVETSCIDSPGLFGALRPRILLPRGLGTQLSEMELRHVFLHEMAHLKRGDLWVNGVMSVVHTLHWFNPLVWFLLRRMRLERELACDALVLRNAVGAESHFYGETILKLLERFVTRTVLTPVVGILEEKHSAASRLKQIAEFKSRRQASSRLGLGLLVALAVMGLSNAQTEKRESAAEKPAGITEIPAAPDGSKSAAPNSRGLDELATEYRNQRKLVENLEKHLDDLRAKLGITDGGFYSSDSDIIRNLERDYTQARSKVAYYSKISSDLKTKDRAELRKVIPTAAPDLAMDRYLGDLAKVEQQFAANISDLGPKHPEIQKLTELMKTINQQIEDRIDGVLAGLELQVAQAQAVADELEKRLSTSRSRADARKSREYDQYSQAKDSLENERRKQEALYLRLEAERIDSKGQAEKTDQPAPGTPDSVSASIAVQDARLLMEMGKLDEAEAKLKQALQADPQNRAAPYYLKLIAERRFAVESRRRTETGPIIATAGPLAPDQSRLSQNNTNPWAKPAPFGTNQIFAKAHGSRITQKLENIVLPEWRAQEGTAFSEIIKNLQRNVRKNDPDQTGVNFVISNFPDAGPAIDPRTGREPVHVEDFEIKANVALSNVRLKDVLQKLCALLRPPEGFENADPVVYSVEDYAVVFQQGRAEEQPLYTRTYRISPERVRRALEGFKVTGTESSAGLGGGIVGVTSTNGTVTEALKNFFVAAGLNFESKTPREQGQSQSPRPQKALFFNENTGILMVRGTLADLDLIENGVQVLNYMPPQVMIETRFVELKAGAAYEQDLLLRLVATNQANSVITVTELMSDPQFKALIEALGNREPGVPNLNRLEEGIQNGTVLNGILTERELRDVLQALESDGVEVLACPRITTLSGRAARVVVEPGPSAAVLATVEPDGKTINLSAEVDMPADKKRKLSAVKAGTTATVWDGQTLAFRVAQRNGESTVVLLTPTIIDPAGNRVHPAGSLPQEVPPQTRK